VKKPSPLSKKKKIRAGPRWGGGGGGAPAWKRTGRHPWKKLEILGVLLGGTGGEFSGRIQGGPRHLFKHSWSLVSFIHKKNTFQAPGPRPQAQCFPSFCAQQLQSGETIFHFWPALCKLNLPIDVSLLFGFGRACLNGNLAY